MKPGILCLLTGTVALAGCASSASGGGTPAHVPKPTTVVGAVTTPASSTGKTSDPRPAATGVATASTVSSASTAQPMATAQLGPAPKPADAYSAGLIAMKQRRYSEAQRDFQIAVEHQQNTEAAASHLGVAALDAGDYPAAYKGYTRASLLKPNDASLIYGAAYSALNSENYHAAIDYARQYIVIRPGDVRGYHVRFLAESHLLQPKQELADARKIVALQPGNAESYNELGIALGNSRQYATSIDAFTRAIKMRPAYAAYYINRALIESMDGKAQAALTDLQTALPRVTSPGLKHNVGLAIANLKKRMRH